MPDEERKVPGVHLSWEEAVRVVPDLVVAEAQHMAADLARCQTRIETLGEQAVYAGNRARVALSDLGESLELMNVSEWERAREYVRMAMNVLQGKERREGL